MARDIPLDSSNWGGGSGMGARSSPAGQNPPVPLHDGSQEGTDRPRWTPPDGSGMWPSGGHGGTQPGSASPGGRNGVPPVMSAGRQPVPEEGKNPMDSAAPRHGMTDDRDGPAGDEDEAEMAEPEMEKRKAIAARHPTTEAPPGGDRFDPAHYDRHMWLQPDRRPEDLCTIRTANRDPRLNPIASAYASNPGSVTLQRIDAARAAAAATTLPGHPSGNPAQRADFSPAPSGHGQQSGTTPQRPGGMPALGSPSVTKAFTSEIGRRG